MAFYLLIMYVAAQPAPRRVPEVGDRGLHVLQERHDGGQAEVVHREADLAGHLREDHLAAQAPEVPALVVVVKVDNNSFGG